MASTRRFQAPPPISDAGPRRQRSCATRQRPPRLDAPAAGDTPCNGRSGRRSGPLFGSQAESSHQEVPACHAWHWRSPLCRARTRGHRQRDEIPPARVRGVSQAHGDHDGEGVLAAHPHGGLRHRLHRIEGDLLEQFGKAASSELDIDRYFVKAVKEIHGVDLAQPYPAHARDGGRLDH